MADVHAHGGHGHTLAAWTAVSLMFVGFLLAGIALPLAQPWLFFVGLGIVDVGAVVGKVMQMMGMGQTVTYKDGHDAEYDSGGQESTPQTAPDTAPDTQTT